MFKNFAEKERVALRINEVLSKKRINEVALHVET